MVVNDYSSRFNLKKLFVIPVVYAVALLLWQVSPLHGVVGLIAATALSAAILLAKHQDHSRFATQFVLTLSLAIIAAFVCGAVISAPGPLVLITMVIGGVLGWWTGR